VFVDIGIITTLSKIAKNQSHVKRYALIHDILPPDIQAEGLLSIADGSLAPRTL
jgi:hypothetical protein